MAAVNTLAQAELAALLSSIAGSHGGTASRPDDDTVSGTLTAITSRWFLGGRKVTSSFTCRLGVRVRSRVNGMFGSRGGAAEEAH